MKTIIADVGEFLRRANRLRGGMLSPHWRANDQPELQSPEPGLPRWAWVGGSVAVAFTVLLWLTLLAILKGELSAATNLNR